MVITWVPVANEGYWKNGKLIGKGQYINENENIIQKGVFDNDGMLHGDDCEVIDYKTENISVRKGSYKKGKEHGDILEYVFPKSKWSDFSLSENVDSTRYRHKFHNGKWSKTNETKKNIKIRGNIIKENIIKDIKDNKDNIISFEFTEK
jgi:hypothetical protein